MRFQNAHYFNSPCGRGKFIMHCFTTPRLHNAAKLAGDRSFNMEDRRFLFEAGWAEHCGFYGSGLWGCTFTENTIRFRIA